MFYFQRYELRKRGGEKKMGCWIHGNEGVWLVTRLILNCQYSNVKYRNNQVYSSQNWCYSNMNFVSQNVLLLSDIFINTPLPDVRRDLASSL